MKKIPAPSIPTNLGVQLSAPLRVTSSAFCILLIVMLGSAMMSYEQSFLSQSGSYLTATKIITPVPNSRILLVDSDFFLVRDTMDFFYDGARIFSSGLVQFAGQFAMPYGLGPSTSLMPVMNRGNNSSLDTLWAYKPCIVPEPHSLFLCGLELFAMASRRRIKSAAAIILLILLNVNRSSAQSPPNFSWAVRAGGTWPDYTYRHAVDSAGNSFLTGEIRTNSPFGGVSGGFVAKYNSAGAVIWSKQFIGLSQSARAEGYGATLDVSGNCFVTGAFYGTVDFGSVSLTSTGKSGSASDIFVAKYGGDGSLLWVQKAGGFSFDAGCNITTDQSGACYVTGCFSGTNADFGSITVTNSNPIFSGLVDYDIFIAKYDISGNVIWAKSSGGNGSDVGYGIASDNGGNVFVSGVFGGSAANFDAITLTNAGGGSSDIFLTKYSSAGSVLWAKRAGGDNYDFADGLALDSDSNCYFTGTFRGMANFGGLLVTNVAGEDGAFLAKYDSSGESIWVIQTGPADSALGNVLALDAFGNCYLPMGFTSTNITFGGKELTMVTAYSSGSLIAKCDKNGSVVWLKPFCLDTPCATYGVGLDAFGNCYISGFFYSTNAFFDGIGLTNTGQSDIFLARLEVELPQLEFQMTPSAIVLSWPTYQAGFALESAAGFSVGETWTSVTNSPVIVGNRFFFTNSLSKTSQFFRLHTL